MSQDSEGVPPVTPSVLRRTESFLTTRGKGISIYSLKYDDFISVATS